MKSKRIFRTDIHRSNLTASKDVKVREVLFAYQKGAVILGYQQWRLFYETGKFDNFSQINKEVIQSIVKNSCRVQSCRYQVVGQLNGWISNRENEFRILIQKSSMSTDMKHQLHTINSKQNWFVREDLFYKRELSEEEKEVKNSKEKEYKITLISKEIRNIARKIIRYLMDKNNKPDLSNIGMLCDVRTAKISRAINTKTKNIGYWVKISTIISHKTINIPLITNEYYEERKGVRSNTVIISIDQKNCSGCGYVDKKNRQSADFDCLWCGNRMHADVNAAKNIGASRACSIGSSYTTKAAILGNLVKAFNVNNPIINGRPELSNSGRSRKGAVPNDPRLKNPYFLRRGNSYLLNPFLGI